MHPGDPHRSKRAFTMLEVLISLVVVSILVTLASITIMGSLASQQLGAAAFHLAGDLTQASQLASTESRTVALTFLEEHDSMAAEGAPPQIRGWKLEAANPATGALEPVADPVRLESGILIMNHRGYSTVLARPREAGEPSRIRFRADGSTDLPTGDSQRWCLTFALESDITRDASALPPNSRTVVINAFTGAVTVY